LKFSVVLGTAFSKSYIRKQRYSKLEFEGGATIAEDDGYNRIGLFLNFKARGRDIVIFAS
jgi:hypothetical protein